MLGGAIVRQSHGMRMAPAFVAGCRGVQIARVKSGDSCLTGTRTLHADFSPPRTLMNANRMCSTLTLKAMLAVVGAAAASPGRLPACPRGGASTAGAAAAVQRPDHIPFGTAPYVQPDSYNCNLYATEPSL